MLARHPGWVVTQGEILAGLFTGDGYSVRMTSTIPNRVLRLADTVCAVGLWRGVDVLVHSLFSGNAFRITQVASAIASARGIPQILVFRGGNLPEYAPRHERRVRRVLDRASVLVSPSGFLAGFFRRWGGYQAEVIPNVLAIDRYQFRERRSVRPRILWMRTFSDPYNPDMAVHALERVLRKHSDATLTMGGRQEKAVQSVKNLVAERGLLDRVRFTGFMEAEDKQREFAEHDIFLNTNRVDNTPVSVLEACAFGLPVVATRVGGIPFLLENEKTALLVNDEDVDGMAAAVSRLCDEPNLSSRLSTNGRKLAESCAWSAVKNQWDMLFEKVLARD